MAVLALSLKLPIEKIGKVLLPINSETIVQKTYKAIRKSIFSIVNHDLIFLNIVGIF
jgi:hypothetical protein